MTSLVAQTVRCLSTIQETRVQSLGQEDLLEKEVATHSSILAWKIPWMEEPGGLQSTGSQRVGHDWVTSFTHTHTHTHTHIYGLQNSLFSQCSICGTVTNCHLSFTLFLRMLLLHCLPFQCIAWLMLVCSGAQSCLTLCDLMNCSPSSCPIHGIFFRQE